jgi:hypothetical protein
MGWAVAGAAAVAVVLVDAGHKAATRRGRWRGSAPLGVREGAPR